LPLGKLSGRLGLAERLGDLEYDLLLDPEPEFPSLRACSGDGEREELYERRRRVDLRPSRLEPSSESL